MWDCFLGGRCVGGDLLSPEKSRVLRMSSYHLYLYPLIRTRRLIIYHYIPQNQNKNYLIHTIQPTKSHPIPSQPGIRLLTSLPPSSLPPRRPSQHLPQNRNTLQNRRQRHSDRIILDPILGVPGRAGPQNDIDDARNGLVERVVQEAWVVRPLVVQDAGYHEEGASLVGGGLVSICLEEKAWRRAIPDTTQQSHKSKAWSP